MKLRFLSLFSFAALICASLPAVEPIRVVATGGRMGNAAYTVSGSVTAFRQRTPHKLGGPVAEIDIAFMNWTHATTSESANPNPVTLNHVWLERASTGQIVPVTFSGGRSLTMPASSPLPYWMADPIPASAWIGAAPARDEVFWLHVKGSVPVGGRIPLGPLATYSGARFVVYDPVNDVGGQDVGGPVPNISGGNVRTSGFPLLFLGRFTGPGYLSVIGVGDSILDGMGDAVNPAPVIAGSGPLCRASLDANGANTIATLPLTRSGQSAGTWVNHHSRQEQILPFANVLVEEFGTNDIGSNGSNANATTIYGRLSSIWTTARAAGIQKIVRTRLLPRTSSATYNWISKADQTPNPGWGAGGARDALNAMFPTALAEGRIDAIADTLTPVQDPTDSHYWLTNGTNDYMTGDGTHLRPAANVLMAATLRATLLTLDIDEVGDDQTVVDNSAGSPAVTTTGAWTPSTTVAGYLGGNYLDDTATGKGSKTARFTPDLPEAGTYLVEARWPAATNHSPSVPLDITSQDGVDYLTIDQTSEGGQWNPLGLYSFAAGTAGNALISNTGTTGRVVADAFRFTLIPPLEVGTPLTVQSWTTAPWNGVNGATSFSANLTAGGTNFTLTFGNPRANVNITVPADPDPTGSSASFFGFEGTGFGVGNSGLGRFDRGESCTLHTNHAITLQRINWREFTGDELLHVQWVQQGFTRHRLVSISNTLTTFSGIEVDANTAITITNVSPATANLTGRLRFNYVVVAPLF